MGESTSTPSAGARPRPVKADGPPERAVPVESGLDWLMGR